MTPELRELYQEVILDHNKRPRNRREVPHATHRAEGHNPLCGDHVVVTLCVQDGRIADVAFEGHGCAISTASASMMTEAVRGKSLEEAHGLFERLHAVFTGSEGANDFGELEALVGVREFPMRVKCATLAWHALDAALTASPEPVTTE